MSRRGRLAVALVAIVLIVAGLLRWGGETPDAEPARQAEARPKRERPRRTRVEAPSLPAAPEPEALPADAPAALPVEVDSAAPERSVATILVYAVYPDGSPVQEPLLLHSRDCEIWRGTPRGPRVMAQTLESGCTVRVGRPDGRLFAWSDAYTLDLSSGRAELEVIIPSEQTGGLGVAFELAEDGMLVSRVWPGSPAERMGLSEGDVILEVDGLPTDALTEDEFISVMTGPVGSEVEFVVGFEADTGWEEEVLTLSRARID